MDSERSEGCEAGLGGRSARVTRRLDRLVRKHRFTIAVVFPVIGALLLVGSAEGVVPAPFTFNPALILLGTLVMRLPLIAGLLPLVDRRLGAGLAALTGYAYAIEFVGVTTGWPYGDFQYVIDLGPMVAGVPIGLPVFFLPLVVNAYLLATLLVASIRRGWRERLAAALVAILGIDLILDPAAVALGFWTYLDGGIYYGVPASNFLGWLLSGTIAVVALEKGFPQPRLRARLRSCEFILDDLVSFVVLWGTINAFYGNWLPVGLVALLVVGLRLTGRLDFDPLDSRVTLEGWRAS
jgi:putative membrane protein